MGKIEAEEAAMDFIRARTEEQILRRQEEIVNACDTLFSQYGYEGVNIRAISKITTFKRTTIYIYYKTKDEVLLDLLKKELLDWDLSLQRVIDSTKTMTKEQYCTFLAESAASRDKMLRLLVILLSTIENQCGIEKLTAFKKETGGALGTIRKSLDSYFPEGDASKKDFFMTAMMSIIQGLYPLAFPSQKQIDAMAMAGREYTAPDFKGTLYRCLSLLLSDL
jgi:AcrR family transcriptional regulator